MYRLYFEMWWRNALLKARQYGYTTFIDLWFLDQCMFHPNVRACIIAHHIDDAKVIFRDKIKYPYQNLAKADEGTPFHEDFMTLHEGLMERIPLVQETTEQIVFGNNSAIRVTTSGRSGNVQLLHVSEYGKMSAKYPDKAREVRIGSFPAAKNGTIIIESTAEGNEGEFYDLCTRAMTDTELQDKNQRYLTRADFKFQFHPWWEDNDYRMDAENILITPRLRTYFEELEGMGIELDDEQKAWYVANERIYGDDMKNEFPSHPQEAFEASLQGAYFRTLLIQARHEGRVTKIRAHDAIPVDTWWDLGVDGMTAIWFSQTVGREIHFIYYMEDNRVGFDYYARVLRELSEQFGWQYGRHVGPHDLEVLEMGPSKTRKESAFERGIAFETTPRVQDKADSIEAACNLIAYCWWDEEHTSEGLKALENYRREWDEDKATYKHRPLANWAAHGADAFQTAGLMHEFRSLAGRAPKIEVVNSDAWT